MNGRSLRVQTAPGYGLAFLVAILWIEIRFRLWTHGVNLLLPYALLLASATMSAFALGKPYTAECKPTARAVRLVLVPLAVACIALFSTSTLWLFMGFAVNGKISITKLDLIAAIPIAFVREAWFPLLTGLAAATRYQDLRYRRAHRP